MKVLGLRDIQAKKFKVTTDLNHNKPVAPDLIGQNFTATLPNEKWVSEHGECLLCCHGSLATNRLVIR